MKSKWAKRVLTIKNGEKKICSSYKWNAKQVLDWLRTHYHSFHNFHQPPHLRWAGTEVNTTREELLILWPPSKGWLSQPPHYKNN